MKRFTGGILLTCFAVTSIVFAQQPDPQRDAPPRSGFRGDSPRGEASPARRAFSQRRDDAGEPVRIPPAGKVVSFNITILEANKAGKQKAAIDLSDADKIAEQLRALEEKGEATVISRVQLSSLEHLPCSVQIGESKPTVTGRAGGFPGRDGARSPGQLNYQYQYANVGMMVKVVSRVESDDAVLAEVELSSSRLIPSPKLENDDAIASHRTTTMSTQSTVRIPKRRAVVVSASQSADTDESRETLVLITAKVESSPAGASAEDAKTAEKSLKTFHLKNASATEAVQTLKTLFADYPVESSADERTNTVIVRAPGGRLDMIEAILRQLDGEDESTFKLLDQKR